jgi:DNA polymerase III alpha subunit
MIGWQIKAAIIAAGLAAIVGAALWLRHDAAQQREADLRAQTYQDRILRMQEAKERRDAAESLDDDGLLDALGRWVLPRPGP